MMLRINKKSIISIVILLSIIYVGLFMDGCMGLNSRESFTQKVLKKKYGEDFIVHEIDSRGSTAWSAIVSPENIPECMFEVIIHSDGSGSITDGSYCNAYANYLMTCILREDLEQFFPSAYIRMESLSMPMDESLDFKNLPLEKIIEQSNLLYKGTPAEGFKSCYLNIYINSETGSTKQYEEEYLYFTDKVNEYISENRMVPIYATFYLVDGETLERVRNYYLDDLDYDSYFQNDVRGNVPEMSACFDTSIQGYMLKDEYIKLRRDFEDGR